jgi:hypothetical protein
VIQSVGIKVHVFVYFFYHEFVSYTMAFYLLDEFNTRKYDKKLTDRLK